MKNCIVLLIACIAFSCNSGTTEEKKLAQNLTVNSGLESFDAFYKKFHSDSLFQIGHIIFPLEGMPGQIDETFNEADFRWPKEEWIMHKAFTEDSTYSQEFRAVGETLIIEIIRLKNTDYLMKRHFALMDEEWKLIYYAGMNKAGSN